jgi:membrane fusion protein, multidrug efflux system
MPGSYARVELPITSEASIVVPAEAVVRSLGSVFVFRVEGDLAVRQEVEIGRRSPSEVEILEGLSPGDLVVTAGVQALRDGAMVEIIGMESR